jgi:hypothetical protein
LLTSVACLILIHKSGAQLDIPFFFLLYKKEKQKRRKRKGRKKKVSVVLPKINKIAELV